MTHIKLLHNIIVLVNFIKKLLANDEKEYYCIFTIIIVQSSTQIHDSDIRICGIGCHEHGTSLPPKSSSSVVCVLQCFLSVGHRLYSADHRAEVLDVGQSRPLTALYLSMSSRVRRTQCLCGH